MKLTRAYFKKGILLLALFFAFCYGVSAETDFPAGNFWALNAGLGMSNFLVDGSSYQVIVDPRLWLSPLLMVGARTGINYSTDEILTIEGQAYMRWNFLRFGPVNHQFNIFFQAGLGLVASYRGSAEDPTGTLFTAVTRTRGSVLADAAIGVTIPLTERWHIEPVVRGGYPHIFGFSVTAGYKFPLPQSRGETRVDYVEVVRQLPAAEIVRIIKISAIEYVLFGPDIGSYNVGIDRDARQLNELVLNYVAQMLRDNSDFIVRLEGHANPHTINRSEAEDLMALSLMRANVIADQLRSRGVSDEQIHIIAFGGTRTVTNEWDIRNRNRRVELMLIQIDADQ